MNHYTIPMALADFIPVAMFAVGSVILQRKLYHMMSKGAFALFAAGTINCVCAGFLKALYKLLYAAGVCDFESLRTLFFPTMSIGFLLAGIGLMAMLFHKQKVVLAAAPPVFSGTFLFVGFTVVGLALMYYVLSRLAVKLKKPSLVIVFVLSFIFSLGMGYLSSRDFAASSMNWIAEGVNMLAQGCYLLGAIGLSKAGVAELSLE
ncbi:MAG: hypothetical protein K6G76_03225 [Lachnospiraceae bacterium]|nr:hypothetical protein [Lachnospiraceae bacterium]